MLFYLRTTPLAPRGPLAEILHLIQTNEDFTLETRSQIQVPSTPKSRTFDECERCVPSSSSLEKVFLGTVRIRCESYCPKTQSGLPSPPKSEGGRAYSERF